MTPFTIIDKINIVQKFIIPEIINSFNIKDNWIIFEDNIIQYIIENYTNESGVRTIKNKIEQIYLSLNLDKYINNLDNKVILTIDIINKILGNPYQIIIKIHDTNLVGVINALYISQHNEGGILPIQITNNYITSNGFDIKITGKQGDIMKESIYCALTIAIEYIKKNLNKYSFINNFDEYLLEKFKYGFHVHVPSVSISKNGSSAGCAYTCAFISKILNIPIFNNIALSGEIDLIGNVFKIGGLINKLIGAKKSNINIVYIPQDNYNDYLDIIHKYPSLINDNFYVKFISHIDDIINNILV
jgi:ATP-dependent Lon protease